MAQPSAFESNIHEYSVSELSGAVKRTIEDSFGFVRVKGELGRVTRAASGHMYMDLKDERAVISGVMWKGMAARLAINPEQGMEVVATGKMTTFPGQSRYQLVIDSLEPAGVGALMALLEQRKAAFAKEGLFAKERKKPLPFLPEVIGVVTSPSGAVIRDILHRLRDRFARHVLVWPTLVQGKGAEEKIAAAIRGFNALAPDGDVPRPDLIIVARGGGSLEDLWCFNEEVTVRAAADSDIPLISAVGHETDTTLIDYAADQRAPTPTAAAEMAVPVRAELNAELTNKARRFADAATRTIETRRVALKAAGRGLGRPEDIVGLGAQRLEVASGALRSALRSHLQNAARRFAGEGARLSKNLLAADLAEKKARLARAKQGLTHGLRTQLEHKRRRQLEVGGALSISMVQPKIEANAAALKNLSQALDQLARRQLDPPRARLELAGRVLKSVSYENVLERGFALVRDADGGVIARAGDVNAGATAVVQFADGARAASFGELAQGAHSAKPQAKGPKTAPKIEKTVKTAPAAQKVTKPKAKKKEAPPTQQGLFDE